MQNLFKISKTPPIDKRLELETKYENLNLTVPTYTAVLTCLEIEFSYKS